MAVRTDRMQDTIFALATPAGRSGVAVIRLSGPQAGEIAESLTGPLPQARKASLRYFYDSEKAKIDRGLLLWFPAPHSFTGEPVAEFHIHGGHAVVERTLQVLAVIPGARPAEAGEFTRRAFENGKLDLTAVEGLADLVAAETEAQRRQALRQMEGELGLLYESWRGRLLRSLAYLEAEIDFSDEDLPEGLGDQVLHSLSDLSVEIRAHLADGGRGEILRRGFRIAILGAPNVGKSSLLNLLAKRDAAIVTPMAGTTRDVIEVNLDLGGYLVNLLDTAGLRRTQDVIEAEGIRRAGLAAESADLKLLVFDALNWPDLDQETLNRGDDQALVILNKIDLAEKNLAFPEGYLALSVKTGQGVEQLLHRLQAIVTQRLGGGDTLGLTRARHRLALGECVESLDRALYQPDKAPELLAEDIRLAMRALGRITGQADVETMLDMLFGEFCIGK